MKTKSADLARGASPMRHVSLALSLMCFALVPACGNPSSEELLGTDSTQEALCNNPDGCVGEPRRPRLPHPWCAGGAIRL